MSLIPFVFREMMAMSRPLRLLENHMRMTEEIFKSALPATKRLQANQRFFDYDMTIDDREKIVRDGDKFEVRIDVSDFRPQEITVKTIDDDRLVTIEAKCERKNDDEQGGGYLAKQLIRTFVVPQGHELTRLVSSLSSDGVLTVTAPKLPDEQAKSNERVVPISFQEESAGEDAKKIDDKAKN